MNIHLIFIFVVDIADWYIVEKTALKV